MKRRLKRGHRNGVCDDSNEENDEGEYAAMIRVYDRSIDLFPLDATSPAEGADADRPSASSSSSISICGVGICMSSYEMSVLHTKIWLRGRHGPSSAGKVKSKGETYA